MDSLFFTDVTLATDPPPLTVPANPSTGKACPECGVNKKSGKRSCCIRGGAWFNKCGDPGDKNFEHTWFEGIEACEGELGRYF